MNMLRKSFLLTAAFLLSFTVLRAEEGMWLPQLLKALNENDMKALGMRMSAEDIYSVNRSSLKDAIVSFGGFCTGEVISDQGLLLTNYHCGYGQIQRHSSVENDLLTNGFWAMSKKDELPNKGLFVTFIVRIEDVTQQVFSGIDPKTGEKELQSIIAKRLPEIKEKATAGTHYDAVIKPFFYGNKYFMFVTESYKDIRLVGAPPSAIGKFGGDTDNWVWPRHTGDFSMFRIYTAPDGSPAEYAEENVPMKPKHFLPINIGGVKPGDFSMVFGFPGRTQEYLTSYAVKPLVETINPARIKVRDEKLAIMRADMQKSDKVRIQYASKYARVANYWKKWIGENRGLKISQAVAAKEKEEKAFQTWANSRPEYASLLADMKKVYAQQLPTEMPYNYMREAVFGAEILYFAYRTSHYFEASEAERAKMLKKTKSQAEGFYKNYNLPTDKALFARLMEMYANDIDAAYHPDALKKAVAKYKGNYAKFAEAVFKKSVFASKEKFMASLSKPKKVLKDPAFLLTKEFYALYKEKVVAVRKETGSKLDLLMRKYVKGLMEMNPGQKFYPDANSTMRVSFGIIDENEPEDGIRYTHQTHLEGIVRKSESGNPDFRMPKKLRDLYERKDYGRWAENGKMPVCFLASNHTTGGNSGSPIIDAEGNLIGLNFDRTWQSTMSDINYNATICRNIGMDVRYLLFIIDKYAGASHLIDEMKIVSKVYRQTPAQKSAAAQEGTLTKPE
ncbi:MAG: S46 family peptidase [Cytophagales bacterium]|nr:S46 family peptidase [Cytophagales bacterium]